MAKKSLNATRRLRKKSNNPNNSTTSKIIQTRSKKADSSDNISNNNESKISLINDNVETFSPKEMCSQDSQKSDLIIEKNDSFLKKKTNLSINLFSDFPNESKEKEFFLPLNNFQSNYLADSDLAEGDDDVDGVEILVKPVKFLINQQPMIKNELPKEEKSEQSLITNIDYKQLLNEFKLDLRNCLPTHDSSFSKDQSSFNKEINNDSFKINQYIEQSELFDHSYDDYNQVNKLMTTVTTTPETTRCFSSRLQSQLQLNHPIQSTPLLERTKCRMSQKCSTNTLSDDSFFLDDDEQDFNELISNIVENYSHQDLTKTNKMVRFSQEGLSIKATIRLPQRSLRPDGILTYEQIFSKLDGFS